MSATVDQCALCGGALQPGETILEIWKGKELIVIKDVPADVCQQCQDAYISPEVSEQLDHFMTEHKQHAPQRYLSVPEYSAAQAVSESV